MNKQTEMFVCLGDKDASLSVCWNTDRFGGQISSGHWMVERKCTYNFYVEIIAETEYNPLIWTPAALIIYEYDKLTTI